jgi:hypothetical protein
MKASILNSFPITTFLVPVSVVSVPVTVIGILTGVLRFG